MDTNSKVFLLFLVSLQLSDSLPFEGFFPVVKVTPSIAINITYGFRNPTLANFFGVPLVKDEAENSSIPVEGQLLDSDAIKKNNQYSQASLLNSTDKVPGATVEKSGSGFYRNVWPFTSSTSYGVNFESLVLYFTKLDADLTDAKQFRVDDMNIALFPQKRNFFSAKKFCETKGYKLPSFANLDQEKAVVSQIKHTFWLDANVHMGSSQYNGLWSGGEKMTYANWSPSKSDFNYFFNCLASSRGFWYNMFCYIPLKTVCMRRTN